MMKRVVILLVFFGYASPRLPYRRRCDPQPNSPAAERQEPHPCVNYKNIEDLSKKQTTFKATQMKLSNRIAAIEIRQHQSEEDLNSVKRETDTRFVMVDDVMMLRRTEANQQVEKIEAKITAMERHLNTQVSEITLLGNNLNETKRLLEVKSNDIEELKGIVQRYEIRLNQTQRDLGLKKGELASLKSTLDNTEKQLAETTAELRNLKRECEAGHNVTLRELNAQKSMLTLLKTNVTVLRERNLNADHNITEERLNRIEKDLEVQGRKVSNLKRGNEAKHNATKTEQGALRSKVTTLQRKVHSQGMEIHENQHLIRKNVARLNETERELETSTDKIANLKRETQVRFNATEAQLETQNETVTRLKHERRGIAAQLEGGRDALENLKRQTQMTLNGTARQLDIQEKKLAHLEGRVQVLDRHKDKTEQHRNESDERHNATERHLDLRQGEFDQLKGKVARQGRKISSNEAKLNQVKTHLGTQIREVAALKTDTEAGFNATNRRLDLHDSELASLKGELNRTRHRLEGELENAKLQTEAGFNASKKDIAALKHNVQELNEHRGGGVGGNLHEAEVRLNETERHLKKQKDELENLQTETKAALNGTRRLLNAQKNELTQLKMTVQVLDVKTEARLNATARELKSELKNIQSDSEEFKENLMKQTAEVDQMRRYSVKQFRCIEGRLRAQKTEADKHKADIGELKKQNAGVTLKLRSVESNLRSQTSVQQRQITEVNRLTREVNHKVAFSATIIESANVFTGPSRSGPSTILIFNKVFTNTGNAYNSRTGIFTAPVKGVYHFTFMTFGYNTYTSGAILVKNGHYQVSTYEFKGPDASDTTSNTVILQMNVRETVNIILWQGGKIHTSVFSGFLVFPL